MTAVPQAQAVPEIDRNLAFLTYALLFFSIFFAGVPALVGVAIAYARRKQAPELIGGHHGFQIRIFWVAFALALLAGAAGLSALLMAVSEGLRQASMDHWTGWSNLRLAEIFSPAAVVFAVLFALLSLTAAMWLGASSIYGAARLASLKPMGQTRR